MATITQSELRAALDYCPETGVFVWVGRSRRLGAPVAAGSVNKQGYVVICLGRVHYLAHRLAWLWMTGAMPAKLVDHINANRADNRWANLRLATKSQNAFNSLAHRDSKSGVKGVTWNRKAQKWQGQIYVSGVYHYLGLFESLGVATEAVRNARSELHGEFARA